MCVDWREGGGVHKSILSIPLSAYWNKNKKTPKKRGRNTERGKQRGDLTCESGNAYLHANYVTRRGERVESAPHAPDRERAREARHRVRHERERRTSD